MTDLAGESPAIQFVEEFIGICRLRNGCFSGGMIPLGGMLS